MHNTSTLQAASHALSYTSPIGLTTVVVQRNSPPLTTDNQSNVSDTVTEVRHDRMGRLSQQPPSRPLCSTTRQNLMREALLAAASPSFERNVSGFRCRAAGWPGRWRRRRPAVRGRPLSPRVLRPGSLLPVIGPQRLDVLTHRLSWSTAVVSWAVR